MGTSMRTSKGIKRAIGWFAIVAVIFLHNDWWLWGNKTMVWDWLPLPALYHLLLSTVVSVFALLLFLTWGMPGKVPPEILYEGKEGGK